MFGRVLACLIGVAFVVYVYTISPTVQAEFAQLWAVWVELAGEWRTLLVIGIVLVVLALGLVKVLDRIYDKHN